MPSAASPARARSAQRAGAVPACVSQSAAPAGPPRPARRSRRRGSVRCGLASTSPPRSGSAGECPSDYVDDHVAEMQQTAEHLPARSRRLPAGHAACPPVPRTACRRRPPPASSRRPFTSVTVRRAAAGNAAAPWHAPATAPGHGGPWCPCRHRPRPPSGRPATDHPGRRPGWRTRPVPTPGWPGWCRPAWADGVQGRRGGPPGGQPGRPADPRRDVGRGHPVPAARGQAGRGDRGVRWHPAPTRQPPRR